MALARRQRRTLDIWPGFVDALANLLQVIIFLLFIFVLAQFFLSFTLSSRDAALRDLQDRIGALTRVLALEQKEKGDLASELGRLTATLDAARAERDRLLADSALLTTRAESAEKSLDEEKALGGKARDEVALLNEQIAALQRQLISIAAALEASEDKAKAQELQIADLGTRLNAALASKVQELNRYRSEFFGKLRELLGDQQDIRIVGDRFVFQSEVLFDTGSADIQPEGREQILKVARTLKDIAGRIPSTIDWILQVEGHTDRVPINTPAFPSNWELSTARAIAVVQLLKEAGVPMQHLAAAGFAEFQPLDAGTDEAALRRNRRIELRLTQR